MRPFVRQLASVVMGLIVAWVITFGIEFVNNQLYPLPPGTDYRDAVSMRAAMATLPPGALVGVLIGWFLAAVAGAWMAVRIARGARSTAWLLGLLLLVAAIRHMTVFQRPIWFWVIGIALYPVAIMLGARGWRARELGS
jgi:hypothetical protein